MEALHPLLEALLRHAGDAVRRGGGGLRSTLRVRLGHDRHPGGERRRDRADHDRLLERRQDRARPPRRREPDRACRSRTGPARHAARRARGGGPQRSTTHGGVSPSGIGRAIWNNVTGGGLAGRLDDHPAVREERLPDPGAIVRSASSRRLVLAVKLETVVSKDEILGDYLNTIYFGRGAYGIETAAERVLRRAGVSELTARAGGRARRDHQVARRLRPGDQPGQAPGPLELRARRHGRAGLAHAEAARRRAELPEDHEEEARETGSPVRTASCSTMVEQAARRSSGFTEDGDRARRPARHLDFDQQGAERGHRRRSRSGPDHRAPRACASASRRCEPGTGEVVAMYGGADFLDDQVNNATQALGQAGSTFKPFALAAATEQGVAARLDVERQLADHRRRLQGQQLRRRVATARSPCSRATETVVNSVYVALESQIGYDQVVDAAVRAGIPADTPGWTSTTDLHLRRSAPPRRTSSTWPSAYATFADRGQQRARPRSLTEVVGPNGGVLFELAPDAPTQAFASDVADTVNYALQQGRHQRHRLRGARRSAVRPRARPARPTSNKSAWFVGYTPQLAAAVHARQGRTPTGIPVSMSGTGGMTHRDRRLVPGAHLDGLHEGRARRASRSRSSSPRRTSPTVGDAAATPASIAHDEPDATPTSAHADADADQLRRPSRHRRRRRRPRRRPAAADRRRRQPSAVAERGAGRRRSRPARHERGQPVRGRRTAP